MENIIVKLGDYTITSDFYILPLGGLPHIVFGVQWLYTVGEVVFNYKMLDMKFKMHGKEVVLHGMKDSREPRIKFHRIEAAKKKKELLKDSWINQEDIVAIVDLLNYLRACNLGREDL